MLNFRKRQFIQWWSKLFHQYQQNKQPSFISNYWTQKKAQHNSIANFGLGQAHLCDRVKPFNGIHNLVVVLHLECSMGLFTVEVIMITNEWRRTIKLWEFFSNFVMTISLLWQFILKGILKLILVIFCISWKLAIGSINDIYETLTRFLSMKLCKSYINRW